MYTHKADHVDTHLPWPAHSSEGKRNHVGNHVLDSKAVHRFDRLLHLIHPQAPHVDADRISTLGRWLQELTPAQARTVLEERRKRIALLRALLTDPDWDGRPSINWRIRRLLAYIEHDREQDLIPDTLPLLGLLDDIILLELAWPALAVEAEDYSDFCTYRVETHPSGDAEHQREAWVEERLRALALFQHHARVNASHYVDRGQPDAPFRVS